VTNKTKCQKLVKKFILVIVEDAINNSDSFRDALSDYAYEKYVENTPAFKKAKKQDTREDLIEDLQGDAEDRLEKEIKDHIKNIKL
jgi:hypothetical protein